MQRWNIPARREHELVAVGMDCFDRVLAIYEKNGRDQARNREHFYDYYIWWMRQAIVEHLTAHP